VRQRAFLGAREAALGHETRLIPPAYVKPFVKRQKNDMADAEAICEAAQRPDDAVCLAQKRAGAGRGRDLPHARSFGATTVWT
jgi:transposase